MNRIGFAYNGGKPKALTMSYDDGKVFDRELVAMFNKYGIRGTFHLNSGLLCDDTHITAEEIPELYRGHEVSCHTLTHPWLERLAPMEVAHEILADKENLERACGYVVRGMSYPFGSYNKGSVEILRSLGMNYSRTVNSTNGLGIPDDFMFWNPTCHHGGKFMERLNELKTTNRQMALLYIWGHSYELPRDNEWGVMEEFCKAAEGMEDVWYATNIEIYDYIRAVRSAEMSADRTLIYNPSAVSIWAIVDGETVECKPGVVTKLC